MPPDYIMIYEVKEEIPLMCIKSPNVPRSAEKTFDKLENALVSLNGRRFYDLFKIVNGVEKYFACTMIETGDEPEKLGFERLVIEKGKYDKERLVDWANNISLMPEYFDRMEARNTVDNSRYSVEYYRSQSELYLMLPIKE